METKIPLREQSPKPKTRAGSVNRTVQLVNFWPTQDLDKYVNLKNRVEARMALVDIAATFEDKTRLLVAKGADVKARSCMGNAAIILAARKPGNSRTVKLLLDRGADAKGIP